jgi:hypothetical protein
MARRLIDLLYELNVYCQTHDLPMPTIVGDDRLMRRVEGEAAALMLHRDDARNFRSAEIHGIQIRCPAEGWVLAPKELVVLAAEAARDTLRKAGLSET